MRLIEIQKISIIYNMRFILLFLFLCPNLYSYQGDVFSLGDDLYRLRRSSGLMIGTTIEARADIRPSQDNGSNLGTASIRFGQLFVSTLNATAFVLPGGSTNYIQNINTLQSDSIFYVSSASIDGQALFNRISGNTGISIAFPLYKLHVVGGVLFTSSITSPGNLTCGKREESIPRLVIKEGHFFSTKS